MSIQFGDNLKHNNPLFPIVDVEDVKGGIRTIATFSNIDLYNAFNDIPDKLKQNYTSLIVTSTSQHYYLTGIDATVTTSWTLTGSGLSGTGTTNSIAKWTGSTSLGDSLITDNGDTVTINGNLNVIGTSSTITSENLLVKDPIILLAGSQSTPLFDSGLFVNRGTGDTQALIWDESSSEFSFFSTTSSSTTMGNVSIGTYSNVRTGALSIGTGTASNSRFLVSSSGGTNSLVVNESGQVSIGGLINPSMSLKVYGNVDVTNFFYTNVTQVSGSVIFDGGGNSGMKPGLEFFSAATNSVIKFTNNTRSSTTGSTTMTLDTTNQFVGIGIASPSTKLHIYATQSGAFRLQDGTEQNDYILKSDSNGVASWVSLSTIGISGASGSVPKFTGTSSLGNSRFFDDGTTGSYGSGTSRVYFLTGGNTWLTLNRSQAAMSFILGNPQTPLFQLGQIQSTNTIGLSIESAGYTQFEVGPSYSISLVLAENGSVYNQSRGISNTIYGYQALLTATASLNNTAFGYQALYSNTANENVAFGYQSLRFNTTGIFNNGFGNYTLYNNTTGGRNIAVGITSLYQNETGNENVAVGHQVLYYNISGSNNTAVGSGAQHLANQSSNNTSVGHQTLYNNLSSSLVAIGSYALTNNTIGVYNTAVGHNSLQTNTTAISFLIIVDSGSGYTASSTYSNIQLSYISGSTAMTYPIVTVYVDLSGSVSTITLETYGTGFKDNTTIMGANLGTGVTFSVAIGFLKSGDNNTTLGYQSLKSNTIGYNNTAIGVYSLYSNTIGAFNTTIGNNSLYYNTTGQSNIVVGESSLYYNTTGSNNLAFGGYTLYSNTTGSNNTGIGSGALQSNITGQYNLALGQSSLITNTSGSFNVAIGISAGYLTTSGLSATGSNNSIFIGYDTRPELNNQTNQIVIGHGATGSGSNSVTLGASTITKTQLRGTINIGNVPQYASNGAAISGGLVPGDIYQTLSNVLMVVI
jgi:hypothetical protein